MMTHAIEAQKDLTKSAGETIVLECSSDSDEYIYWNYPREEGAEVSMSNNERSSQGFL